MPLGQNKWGSGCLEWCTLISLNFELIHSWVSLFLSLGVIPSWTLPECGAESPWELLGDSGWGDLPLLFSLTPSINCYKADYFSAKVLISTWIPAVSPFPLSSGVFSVPEVFSRIWHFCFFYFWGVKCTQGDKSVKREKNTQAQKPNNVERKKWRYLWLPALLTFQ